MGFILMRQFNKRFIHTGLAVGALLLSGCGSDENANEPEKGNTTVVQDFDDLESYILDTYEDDENVENVVYAHHKTTEESLYITDYSDEDAYVPEYEEEKYAGTVEYNETSNYYSFNTDVKDVEYPIEESITNRVLIPKEDSTEYSEDYRDVFYTDGSLDVDTSYFMGDYDYSLIRVEMPDLEMSSHIRYVQPDSYAFLEAEKFMKNYEADGYVVSKEYYDIGETLYLRYEITDYVEPEKAEDDQDDQPSDKETEESDNYKEEPDSESNKDSKDIKEETPDDTKESDKDTKDE